MADKVLFVDDEENILQAYARNMRRRFNFETALGGAEALAKLATAGPYAVVISDMRMPGIDGLQVLAKVKKDHPDTIRIMLTGNADQATAMEAVNQSEIFRFLNKPCEPEVLAEVVQAALRQHRLVTAEKELLEQTVKGAVQMLVELLSLLDPDSFGRAQRLAALSEKVGRHMNVQAPWVLGVAAVLSQIGVLTLPPSVVTKVKNNGFLNSAEREISHRIPEIGSNLIRNIPRLDEVAEIVYYSQKNFNGSGFPVDNIKEGAIPLGSRILRATTDLLNLSTQKSTPKAAVQDMQHRTAWYDHEVLRALQVVLEQEAEEAIEAPEPANLTLEALTPGMLLVQSVETTDGWLVVPAGTLLGSTHIEKLRNFDRLTGLRLPILAVLPRG